MHAIMDTLLTSSSSLLVTALSPKLAKYLETQYTYSIRRKNMLMQRDAIAHRTLTSCNPWKNFHKVLCRFNFKGFLSPAFSCDKLLTRLMLF